MTNADLERRLATALEDIEGKDHLEWPSHDADYYVSPGGMWCHWYDGDPEPLPFTTDGNAFFALVAAMKKEGWLCDFDNTDDIPCAMFYRGLDRYGHVGSEDGEGDSIPLAVATAAAKALGVYE